MVLLFGCPFDVVFQSFCRKQFIHKMNLVIVDRVIADIIALTIDTIVDHQMDKQLPAYVYAGVNSSLCELGRFGLNNKSSSKQGQRQSPMIANKMRTNPIIDNRSTSRCKSIIVTNQQQKTNNNPLQGDKRSISGRSKQLLIDSCHSCLDSSSKGYTPRHNEQKSESNNFIKLSPQPTNKQIQQMQMEEKLRKQLEISRLKIRKQTQTVKKKRLLHLAAKDKNKNIKDFTFGYDFQLLKLNQFQSKVKDESSQRSSRKITQLKIRFSNKDAEDKKKYTSLHVKSTPQISHLFVPSSNRKQQQSLPKLVNTPNQDHPQSHLQTLLSQSSLNNGVFIKQHINSRTIKFKKDTPTSKSLLDLNQSEFQFTTQKKRFRPKNYRPEQVQFNLSERKVMM